ncbi:MAG: hypothetical protein ACXVFF_07440, partial [Gaiellaceae bacterium]
REPGGRGRVARTSAAGGAGGIRAVRTRSVPVPPACEARWPATDACAGHEPERVEPLADRRLAFA